MVLSQVYNTGMNQSEFAQDSKDLMNVLLQRGKELVDKIDDLDRSSEDYSSYYAYLKDFPINSGCLCDDILQAAHNDAVLLAMSGARVVLEDAINIHYLESKSDEAERIKVAIDWFRLSNDPKAFKNMLDTKSVAARAEAAGEDARALYDGEYADFCNYTHSTAQRAILNASPRVMLANKAVMVSLKAYANIITCLERIMGEEKSEAVAKGVSAYLDKYRTSVAEASLPSLDADEMMHQ